MKKTKYLVSCKTQSAVSQHALLQHNPIVDVSFTMRMILFNVLTLFAFYAEPYDKRGPDINLQSTKEINPRAYKLTEARTAGNQHFDKYGNLRKMVFVNRPETNTFQGGTISINLSNKLTTDPSSYIDNNLYKTLTPGAIRMQARS